ncbi:hypothetical protein F383_37480 [Gossypium arboreum]|uniref:Uncharacterized protein n=1 Tax=Gossypium arboreum TaxID=29729 RepID=A0A0B0MHI8_GOSAR|nr:hypothetical protein F383_37480 [Gossypium arboreum]
MQFLVLRTLVLQLFLQDMIIYRFYLKLKLFSLHCIINFIIVYLI